jgi:1,2-dihydroxy-3-keto-5-methylthiopentene dioxygenase
MSALLVYAEDAPASEPESHTGVEAIAHELSRHGVRFTRWPLCSEVDATSAETEIVRAYAPEIESLSRSGGYRSVDVVRLQRDPADAGWSEKARGARLKFLDEHRHAEDEVRFFVDGTGLFALRSDGKVLLVLCQAGDLISVPAGTRHWFDMGSEPSFCAIRWFGSPDGWLATFTGDPIARRFPGFDEVAARWR